MRTVYLDNSATTRVCPEAAEAALQTMTEIYGNPSSLHSMGFAAEMVLKETREAVASLLSVPSAEVVFTSGGTEANNIALFGAAQAGRRNGARIVTTAIEHPSVLRVMDELKQHGFTVVTLAPDCLGRIDPEQIRQAVTPDTILVSMMAVNNEIGTILPVQAAAEAIRRSGSRALLHVDAVQAFGKIPLHPKKQGILSLIHILLRCQKQLKKRIPPSSRARASWTAPDTVVLPLLPGAISTKTASSSVLISSPSL